MQVSLIDYTGYGLNDPADHAMNVLIFSKSTRLKMSPALLEAIAQMDPESKEKEIQYIANTIPSSWEMIHYTFLIEKVTRAFTHQFVRTRNASYAQQTMRVLEMEDWTYGTGPTVQEGVKNEIYVDVMENIRQNYNALISRGAKIEDARGILPTNIHTNIMMSCNLRTFVEMVRKRTSPRVQGEYREVIEKMIECVLSEHPFVKYFIDRTVDRAMKDLDKEILEIEDEAKRLRMVKLVDQCRQNG